MEIVKIRAIMIIIIFILLLCHMFCVKNNMVERALDINSICDNKTTIVWSIIPVIIVLIETSVAIEIREILMTGMIEIVIKIIKMQLFRI